ncbi:hypothetical protein GYA49_04970 [Candidatus Beckwithbacteria bacterium]|nr:hypothetical protein [Candidatus Beckwithbacteria bacterium]
MSKQNNDFFQPIISVFGLAISILTTLLPLFNQNFVTRLFINKELIKPFSFIAFTIGIAIVWIIWNFHPYPYINIWKVKKNDLISYKIRLQTHHILWLLVLLIIFFSSSFFYIGLIAFNKEPIIIWLSILQSLLYMFFFLTLISIFAFLFIQSKMRFENKENQSNLPFIVFETLDKNRLVKPGIEVYENILISFQDAQRYELQPNIYRKFKVITQPKKKEVLEFITSMDGKEIVKILKKESLSEH